MHYGNRKVHPQTVLSLEWNERLRHRATYLAVGLGFAECSLTKEYVALGALQILAKNEDPSFRFVEQGEYRAAIIFPSGGHKCAGFLVWSEEENCTLHQIFVVAEERGKGYAKAALRHWVKEYAERLSLPFFVESPNEKSEGLLVALGYAGRRGNQIVGTKCRFVTGL